MRGATDNINDMLKEHELFQFSTHIADLKKKKEYDGAISFFKKNKADFSKEQIANIHCIRHNFLFETYW